MIPELCIWSRPYESWDEEQQAQEQAFKVKERCKANTFMIESANFMTQDTSSPLNARLATTINVTGL